MTLAPPSPRFRVSSVTRAPIPRDSYVSMPPSSSSGWAVTIMRLARVWSFLRLCHTAAVPRFMGTSYALDDALIDESYGVCAYSSEESRRDNPTNRARFMGNLIVG